MSKLTDMIFGTHSQRELRRIEPLVKKIEDLRPQMTELSDDQLRAKTDEFKKRLADCWSRLMRQSAKARAARWIWSPSGSS